MLGVAITFAMLGHAGLQRADFDALHGVHVALALLTALLCLPVDTRPQRTMKAFVLERYGKRRALQMAEMPIPELRDDEVLVQVHAAGVNLLDAKIRNGEFKLILPYRMPLILGHDVAGEVVAVGRSVRGSSSRRRSLCTARRLSDRHVC